MAVLLLQMTTVLLTALLCGSIARRLGQSQVIGEIAGGILLGPSVFGRIAPTASAALFPASSLPSLEDLSTLGLILFLFLIGYELDWQALLRHKTTAALTSSLSMALPFVLAVALAPALLSRFAPAGIARLPFTLFLGISLSITAFPVLARILEERRMQATPLGTTALLCAAVDDLCAWMLLALALTLLPHSASSTPLSHRLLALLLYLAVMLLAVRPLGAWIARRRRRAGLSYQATALLLALLLASAAATEAIGVHPLFGAFLAGLCSPRIDGWQATLRTRFDTVVSLLLLPIFFALTGLRTRLDLLTGVTLWFWTAAILLTAVAGKIGGALIASRLTGHSWRNALALGVLLNTRGLVELIVLNVAYTAHVFSPILFSMLVLMALITTAMTTPLLNLLRIGDANLPARSHAP